MSLFRWECIVNWVTIHMAPFSEVGHFKAMLRLKLETGNIVLFARDMISTQTFMPLRVLAS